jgi:hypothetical protein
MFSTLKKISRLFCCCGLSCCQCKPGCQMVYLHTQNPKFLIYFTAISSILWPLGIFLRPFWYIFWSFGIFSQSGNPDIDYGRFSRESLTFVSAWIRCSLSSVGNEKRKHIRIQLRWGSHSPWIMNFKSRYGIANPVNKKYFKNQFYIYLSTKFHAQLHETTYPK